MIAEQWLLCPICKSKTRLKLLYETELRHFPLFCPKCKKETVVNVKGAITTIIKEPDAVDCQVKLTHFFI